MAAPFWFAPSRWAVGSRHLIGVSRLLRRLAVGGIGRDHSLGYNPLPLRYERSWGYGRILTPAAPARLCRDGRCALGIRRCRLGLAAETSPWLLIIAAASGSSCRKGMCPAPALRPDRHHVAGHRRRRVEERGALHYIMPLLYAAAAEARPSLHLHPSAWPRRRTPPIPRQGSAASRSRHHDDRRPPPCRPGYGPAPSR